MEATLHLPARLTRQFLPETFTIDTWANLEPWFKELENREIATPYDLKNWLLNRSELESALEEEMGWRYIRMSCDTNNQEYKDSFVFFVSEIEPHVAPYTDLFNRKLVESKFAHALNAAGEKLLLRNLKSQIEIYRSENIPLLTELQTEQQKYGATVAAMTINHNGSTLTLQQAGVLLQDTDRNLRKEVYSKIQERRMEDSEALDKLFDDLINTRQQVATNAGFSNFRDYMFKALARFDYSVEDCHTFHTAVSGACVPILDNLMAERKKNLQLDTLRPYDLAVDEFGAQPLKPFTTADDLLQKTIACFNSISPELGNYLVIMKEMGHLDLESRVGKAPGGYNYPLDETGVPFIFMNATATLRDLVTLLHEGGHAIHSFLTRDLPLGFYKHSPSEVAELASMSMELISMEHWDVFFENRNDLVRAKRQHLQGIIETLPWVATIDNFQHWLYENKKHSVQERRQAWNGIYLSLSSSIVDWTGLEKYRSNMWQKQLHLFEVPFYYIEYGIAQLGAIAVWKNYRSDPKKGLENYLNALKLGNTVPIKDVYAAAGIQFDFTLENINELMQFVQAEMDKLA
jgi:oligoendopeptidase F